MTNLVSKINSCNTFQELAVLCQDWCEVEGIELEGTYWELVQVCEYKHARTFELFALRADQLHKDEVEERKVNMYDCVYYWLGGTVSGSWRKATGADLFNLRNQIYRSGRVALLGSTSLGAPEGAPVERLADLDFLIRSGKLERTYPVK